jgi:alpha-glucosidase
MSWFRQRAATGRWALVIANLPADPVATAAGSHMLVSSSPMTEQGHIPTDSTVWLGI